MTSLETILRHTRTGSDDERHIEADAHSGWLVSRNVDLGYVGVEYHDLDAHRVYDFYFNSDRQEIDRDFPFWETEELFQLLRDVRNLVPWSLRECGYVLYIKGE